jgi:flagellar biogenesis protein FliO
MALSGLLFLMLAIVVAVVGTVGWQVRRLVNAATPRRRVRDSAPQRRVTALGQSSPAA